jgi:broad specificity phosphatase PhoE
LTKPLAPGALLGATLVDQDAEFARLVLVRHGRPALSRKVHLDWRGYRAWWAAYGESELAEGQVPPPALVSLAGEADIVVASPLPRAGGTAARLSHDGDIITDSVFVEAPLPAPQIPFVRLRPGTWNVLSRLCWLLGYAARGESHRHAEVRAEEAADRLVELARGRSLVVLAGHGWFNRMIRGVLRRRGWQCVYDGGDGYWSWRSLTPPGTAAGKEQEGAQG